MKALITGSGGFIGQHLSNTLRDMGAHVYGLEREKLDDPDKLYHDIYHLSPDFIFHLAAYGNHSNQKDPVSTIMTNVVKTFYMFETTRNIPYSAFINFGSSSEYGHKDKPMNEEDLPETDTFYGASKVSSTYLAKAYATQYKKPIVTVRPFSVYGEGEADFRLIPTLCNALIGGKKVALAKEPTHDWIYIKDFIEGVLTVTANIQRLRGQVINIGTGTQYTNKEVAEALEHISGKKFEYKKAKYEKRPYDSSSWVADSSKLLSLGWKPKSTLLEGLKNTYSYYLNTHYSKTYGKQRPQEKNN